MIVLFISFTEKFSKNRTIFNTNEISIADSLDLVPDRITKMSLPNYIELWIETKIKKSKFIVLENLLYHVIKNNSKSDSLLMQLTVYIMSYVRIFSSDIYCCYTLQLTRKTVELHDVFSRIISEQE